MEEFLATELAALRKEIEALRAEINRCIGTETSQNTLGALETFRKDTADAIIAGELVRARETLETQAKNCPAKEQCLPQFEKTLAMLLNSLKSGSISTAGIPPRHP